MKSLSRDQLEAELIRLQELLRQAGIDARLSHQRQSQRDATHLTDLSISRAETAAARDSARAAHLAPTVAEARFDHSQELVAELRDS